MTDAPASDAPIEGVQVPSDIGRQLQSQVTFGSGTKAQSEDPSLELAVPYEDSKGARAANRLASNFFNMEEDKVQQTCLRQTSALEMQNNETSSPIVTNESSKAQDFFKTKSEVV